MTIWEIFKKELLQIKRDKRLVFILIFLPLVQMVLFGYAVNLDVKHLNLYVCDLDQSQESRKVVQDITSSPYFDYKGLITNLNAIRPLLDRNEADLVLVIHRQFGREIQGNATANIQVLVDGSNPNTGTLAAGYLGSYFQEMGVQLLQQRSDQKGLGNLGNAGVDGRIRFWYNPALKSPLSLVPGVVALVVGLLVMVIAALSVVRERDEGTIEQLMVTPIRPWQLILGKSLPVLLVGYMEIIFTFLVDTQLFHVPMRGSLILLFVLAAPFLIGSLAIGLAISVSAKTQQQAQMTVAFLSIPNMLLSGFIFPIQNMPVALQWATLLLPMRYFLVIIRNIQLKGSDLFMLRSQVIPMILLSLFYLVMAVSRFHKKLD